MAAIDRKLKTNGACFNLLERRILFKESKLVDKNQALLKQKYTAINSRVASYAASPSFSKLANPSSSPSSSNSSKPHAKHALDDFAHPEYYLCSPDAVKIPWEKMYTIGPGLHNMGNTCFLNSVLQCLTYTSPLAQYLLQNHHSKTCKLASFCALCELELHVRSCFDVSHASRALQPKRIVFGLKYIAKHLRIGRQEDAHEFMRYFIDSLQENLLQGLPKKLDPRIKETTLIHQIFGGYLRSQVTCLTCRNVSNTYDALLDVSLELKGCETLERALQKFTKPETLSRGNQYKCPKCKKLVDGEKQITFYKPPPVLTLQLKRFTSEGFGAKVGKTVTFPEKLDVSTYLSKEKKYQYHPKYNLFAVIVHSGKSTHSGHYYAYVRNSTGIWYIMNDSQVNQVSLKTVLSQKAYVLFYSRDEQVARGADVDASELKKQVMLDHSPVIHSKPQPPKKIVTSTPTPLKVNVEHKIPVIQREKVVVSSKAEMKPSMPISVASPIKVQAGTLPKDIILDQEKPSKPVTSKNTPPPSPDSKLACLETAKSTPVRKRISGQWHITLFSPPSSPLPSPPTTTLPSPVLEEKSSSLEVVEKRDPPAIRKQANPKPSLMTGQNPLELLCQQENVATWDGDSSSSKVSSSDTSKLLAEREALLNSLSSNRKRPSRYDLEYDAGHSKKKKLNGAKASWNPQRKHQFQKVQEALQNSHR